MAVNNITIAAQAWLAGTNDFQQRVTNPTIGGMDQFMIDLYQPMNRDLYNQFLNWLMNAPAMTVVHGKKFNNPLKEFKSEKILYGNSIQNVVFEWIKAHGYTDDNQALFKMHRPKGAAWYVSQNRRDYYPITTVEQELRTAVQTDYGINNLVQKITELPYNSDEYDEFLITLNLLALYHVRWGFYMRNLTAAPNDEESGKEFLRKVKEDGKLMRFPSVTYNAQNLKDIPVFVNPEDLILITTPGVSATLDVDTYAAMFNMDVAKASARIVEVPYIPIPGAVAILTTKDIFDIHDTYYGMQSQFNYLTLGTHWALHHWGIYGLNPYVPAVLYTTLEGTETPTITQEVTGLTLTAESNTASCGQIVNLYPELQGTIDSDRLKVSPKACTWGIQLEANSGSEFSTLKAQTRVDQYGRLHIQDEGLSAGDVLKVQAVSTYWNPTAVNNNTRYSAEVEITIE